MIILHGKERGDEPGTMHFLLRNYELLQDRISSEGRHLVLGDREKRHRLLITTPRLADSAYVIPRDHWLPTRLAAIDAFDASCRRTRLAVSKDTLLPTAYQRHRLILLLEILDAIHRPKNDFATIREIAQKVIYRHENLGRAIEWKSSSRRRQTQRLIGEARFFVDRGYRLLLKGRTHKNRDISDMPIDRHSH